MIWIIVILTIIWILIGTTLGIMYGAIKNSNGTMIGTTEAVLKGIFLGPFFIIYFLFSWTFLD